MYAEVQLPVSQIMTLFRHRVIENVTGSERVEGPNITDVLRRWSCKDTGRSQPSTSQGRAEAKLPNLGKKHGTDFFPQPSEETDPANT